MATTITPAEAALQVQLALTLGTRNPGFTHSSDTTGMVESYANTITVPYQEEVVILDHQSIDNADSSTDFEDLILINKDDTNFAKLKITNSDGHVLHVPLRAGKFVVIPFVEFDAGVFAAYSRIIEVAAQADTSNVDIEITAYR